MCLIVFSYQDDPDYPFILATNRDEFYERPTEPVHRWDTSPPIIAGKDKKAGGTWLGISETGRFSALTNHRKMDEIKESAPSRGNIVKNFLLSDQAPHEYLAYLQNKSDIYNGFNLIAGTLHNLYYISNKKKGVYKIEPGIHSISNAFLNTPWPKTEYTSRKFKEVLNNYGADEEKLFDLLLNDNRYPEKNLPDTGLPKDLEKAVSSAFIKTENYGTRSSTLVIADKNYNVTLVERTFKPGTKETVNTVRHTIDL